jgi:hypothetical protein
MYVSFDDGAHWRPLQLNLPITPVTDIRVHRQDLVVSTQGRSFWILDDLTPLHQLSDAVARERAHLFAPRVAIRYRYRAGFGGIEGDRGVTDDAPQYPPAGAMIDYSLATAGEPATVDILDAKGALVRSFSSDSVRDSTMARAGTPRLTTRAGLNRFVWDMNYPGPWSANAGQRGRSGPMAAPGTYTVRISAGGSSATVPLVLRADPRVLRDGVSQKILEEQLAFNLRVRDLVSDANRTADELRALRPRANGGDSTGASSPAIAALERELFTPSIRYSRPALLTHITYLYSMTLGADQPVSRDAYERYAELRSALDDLKRRISAVPR